MKLNYRKLTYGYFATAFDPFAGILQCVQRYAFTQCHRFRVIRPEEVMTLVGFGCLTAILSQIENCCIEINRLNYYMFQSIDQ